MVAEHGATALHRLCISCSLTSWPRFLFLILGLVSIGLALSFFVSSIGHPYVGIDGVLKEGRWAIGTVDRSGLAYEAGLQTGNDIVAINGQPVEQFSQGLTFISARVIDEVTVVNSAGELQSVTVAGSKLPSAALTECISFFVISLSFWFTGLFVLIKKTNARLARLLSLLCFAIAVAVVAPLAGVRDILWGPHLEIVSYLLGSPLFFHFCLLFPRDQDLSGYSRYLPAALYVLSSIIMLCYALFGYRESILYPWFRTVILADLILGLTLGIIALVRNYFGTAFARAKQQIKIVTVGTLIGVLPVVSLSLLPNIIGERMLVEPHLTVLGIILVPLTLAYAVVRYKLLDIDLIIARGLSYGTIAAAIMLSYALLTLVLATFLSFLPWVVHTAIIIAFSCIVILLFAPLRTRLQYLVDRRIYKDRYDYKYTLSLLTSTISSITDLETLSRYLVDSVSKNLGLSGACLLLRDQDGNLVPAAAVGECEQDSFQMNLAGYAKTLKEENKFPYPAPTETGVSFFVFLTARGRELGVLCLGHKVSRVPFTVDDISFLVTVSHPAAMAIENALLVADAEAKELELKGFKAVSDRAAYGAAISTLDGNLVYVNETFAGMHGYTIEELTGKHITVLHSEHQMKLVEGLISQLVENGSFAGEEVWHKRKDGTVFPTLMTGIVVADREGNPLYLAATAIDVAQRKQAEEELEQSRKQLRDLSAHLQSVREAERTGIAREIHDELGQALTALKMDLSWLGNRLPNEQASLFEKTKSMSRLIDGTIQSVKRISSELRPGVLDDLGLVAAIEWQAEEFQKRTGIKCEVSTECEDIVLDQERATAIFRIFQEALTNVSRHASATGVKVSLKKKDKEVLLGVRDDGKGITPEQMRSPRAFGLMGMQERARYWGGDVTIAGAPGEGTTVRASIPIIP